MTQEELEALFVVLPDTREHFERECENLEMNWRLFEAINIVEREMLMRSVREA